MFAIFVACGNKVLGKRGEEGVDERDESGDIGNGSGGKSEGSKRGEFNGERFGGRELCEGGSENKGSSSRVELCIRFEGSSLMSSRAVTPMGVLRFVVRVDGAIWKFI